MKKFFLVAALTWLALWPAAAEHPQLLVVAGEREVMRKKVETVPWARAAYEKMKGDVDKVLAQRRPIRSGSPPGWR